MRDTVFNYLVKLCIDFLWKYNLTFLYIVVSKCLAEKLEIEMYIVCIIQYLMEHI